MSDTYSRTGSGKSPAAAGPRQAGVGGVGLGRMLATPRRLGVGRFRQGRQEPGGFDLLDHPAGATVQRTSARTTWWGVILESKAALPADDLPERFVDAGDT
jgi:hypothetical protein